ncbi:hypothetical protein LSAT2_013529 [Lamellibrachia satsuma]|nr:hypothetical protein LSAT2_013529 [Lamellibrachia satsuma]
MTWAVPGYLPQHQLPAGTPDVPSPSPRTPANRRPEKHRLPTQCLRGYRGVALLVVFLAVAMISAIGTAIYLAGEENSTASNTASEAPTTSSVTETSTVTIQKPEETTTTVTASEAPFVTTSTAPSVTASEAPSVTPSTAPSVTASEAPYVTTSTASEPTGTTSVTKPTDVTPTTATSEPTGTTSVTKPTDVTPTTASEAPTTSSVTETSTVTTPKPEETTTVLTFCERETPCQNGRTCVDLPKENYVCVCPKCECSSEKPLDNCTIDEANICKIENIKNDKVAHPYSCSKYIDCSGASNTFRKTDDVWHHKEGNVYNPQTGDSATSGIVICATQTNPTPCAADTCANGGTCADTMSGFKCKCSFGRYNGLNCENKLNSCDDVDCQHGTCENTENGFYCNCSENYVGKYCQDVKVPCSSVNCLNGGTCRDTDVGYKCECVAGFTGNKCETDIDECASNPCHPDYTTVSCVDRTNSYECTCYSCNCSSVVATDDCTVDAVTACKNAKATHSGKTEYRIAHPYKCNKHIWCYSSGDNGIEQTCAGSELFNPNYTDNSLPCTGDVPQCTQR